MKKLLLAVAISTVMAAAPAIADSDQSIMLEFGIGFGNASGGRSDGNDNSKWCKNRNTGRMAYMAVRLRDDDVEAHVARWFHDEDVANCDRDSWAAGVGYVIDTQGSGDAGYDDQYISWTPGIAYTWGEDKGFTGQDSDNTNWRQTGNWQTFNRVAVGATTEDNYAVELAVHRYGTFNPEHGEYFVTVGAMLRDLGSTDERGLTPPTEDNPTEDNPTEDTCISDCGDTFVDITIVDGNTGDNNGELNPTLR